MLETVDLSKKLKKKEYRSASADLELELGALQRRGRSQKIPIILLFEGWDAAGKGTLINRLILAMDSRGVSVHPTFPPDEEEALRPFLWRFWRTIPENGRVAVYDRSWYRRVLTDRIDGNVPKKEWNASYDEIRTFERHLTDDGYILLKFFLHISKKEQKKRFKALESDSSTTWRVSKEDWKHHKQYDKYVKAVEDMLALTETDYAPWTIIESQDLRFATVKLFQRIVDGIEKRMPRLDSSGSDKRKTKKKPAEPGADVSASGFSTSILEGVDLSISIDRDDYKKKLKASQARIRQLEFEIYRKRIPVVIVYEGWDAAGKGGNIRRLVQALDPRGYEVIPIAGPNDTEKAHHYLWRFWMEFPKAGHIAIFDRSWYGRILVERVEEFCMEEEWRRAYREINEMERQWISFGAVLVKLWLQIDRDEQLRRFEERQGKEHKKWKITDEDWRNREKWDVYNDAVNEMILRTSPPDAPWTVVEANSKFYARIKALETVVRAIEKKL